MSTIEIDEKSTQGRRRWLGSKSSTNRLRALAAACIFSGRIAWMRRLPAII